MHGFDMDNVCETETQHLMVPSTEPYLNCIAAKMAVLPNQKKSLDRFKRRVGTFKKHSEHKKEHYIEFAQGEYRKEIMETEPLRKKFLEGTKKKSKKEKSDKSSKKLDVLPVSVINDENLNALTYMKQQQQQQQQQHLQQQSSPAIKTDQSLEHDLPSLSSSDPQSNIDLNGSLSQFGQDFPDFAGLGSIDDLFSGDDPEGNFDVGDMLQQISDQLTGNLAKEVDALDAYNSPPQAVPFGPPGTAAGTPASGGRDSSSSLKHESLPSTPLLDEINQNGFTSAEVLPPGSTFASQQAPSQQQQQLRDFTAASRNTFFPNGGPNLSSAEKQEQAVFQHNKLMAQQAQMQQQQRQYMPKAVSPFASSGGHPDMVTTFGSSPVEATVFQQQAQQGAYGRIGQMTPHQQVPYNGLMQQQQQQRSSPGAMGTGRWQTTPDGMAAQSGMTGGYHPAQLKQMNGMQSMQSLQAMQQSGAEVPAGYGVPPQSMQPHGHAPGSKVVYQPAGLVPQGYAAPSAAQLAQHQAHLAQQSQQASARFASSPYPVNVNGYPGRPQYRTAMMPQQPASKMYYPAATQQAYNNPVPLASSAMEHQAAMRQMAGYRPTAASPYATTPQQPTHFVTAPNSSTLMQQQQQQQQQQSFYAQQQQHQQMQVQNPYEQHSVVYQNPQDGYNAGWS
ncbi:hypothetical protein RvY_11775 [Ramazzottius varieornatus]|uniref:Uncharacterized protein n=1 Tax=Ramazzottius varieornatus TaxID=947166 RepID=A0A1D1VML8_RAMVA|nr:hypothetical protein RvY_11775 [Ramazzottius varieornatus]